MKRFLYAWLLILLYIPGHAQPLSDEKEFLQRSCRFLLATNNAVANITSLLTINADGSWTDIDYNNNEPGVWSTAEHLRRTRALALAWSQSTSSWYHNVAVKQTIIATLNNWGTHRYQNKNWWHNQIGVPQIARDILLLMSDSLPAASFTQALAILGQYNVCCTGANLVWSAGLGLYYGAFTNNMSLMKQCRDTILSTITISTQEGVQPDFSFHQHNSRLQIYHYGGAFLRDNIQLAWELRPTALAYPAEKINILTGFVLHGWQWMARGIHTAPGTVDRAVSRMNALQNADIREVIPYLYELAPDSTAAFKRLLAAQQGQYTLTGYRYFPRSDFTAYHQPNFSFFLKTNSVRTLLTESINEENQQGALLASGDSYFIINGQEYFNLQPCWDWDALPGITNFTSDSRNSIYKHSFTGNVSDSIHGLAAMDYELRNGAQRLTAKKSWACYKGVVVALIAGLEGSNTKEGVYTVLDQSRWQSTVTINKPQHTLLQGIHKPGHTKWIHHGKLVYMPLGTDSMRVQIENKEGRWTTINRSQPAATVHDKLFTARLIHNKTLPATGYVVGYAATPSAAGELARHPFWKIISNDSICQAVQFEQKVIMAAWYKAGKRHQLQVNQPCLLLVTPKGIYISDPLHVGGTFTGTIRGKQFSVIVPADGTTVQITQK